MIVINYLVYNPEDKPSTRYLYGGYKTLSAAIKNTAKGGKVVDTRGNIVYTRD